MNEMTGFFWPSIDQDPTVVPLSPSPCSLDPAREEARRGPTQNIMIGLGALYPLTLPLLTASPSAPPQWPPPDPSS